MEISQGRLEIVVVVALTWMDPKVGLVRSATRAQSLVSGVDRINPRTLGQEATVDDTTRHTSRVAAGTGVRQATVPEEGCAGRDVDVLKSGEDASVVASGDRGKLCEGNRGPRPGSVVRLELAVEAADSFEATLVGSSATGEGQEALDRPPSLGSRGVHVVGAAVEMWRQRPLDAAATRGFRIGSAESDSVDVRPASANGSVGMLPEVVVGCRAVGLAEQFVVDRGVSPGTGSAEAPWRGALVSHGSLELPGVPEYVQHAAGTRRR